MRTPYQPYQKADYDTAAEYIRQHSGQTATIGITLGSGLGDLAEKIESPDIINYADIPGWPRPQSVVEGHKLRIIVGKLGDQTVLVLQGRQHFYEGYTMQESTFPVRVMAALDSKKMILTNAAGGINRDFAVGDLMLIVDHINLTGTSPLISPNDPYLGPRFPNMVYAYDAKLGDLARRAAAAEGIPLREGVYVGLAGPSYETPAEIRMLRILGADAVGMSTVPEVIVARHAGLDVLGISTITNIAIDTLQSGKFTNHAEVMSTGKRMASSLEKLIRRILVEIDNQSW